MRAVRLALVAVFALGVLAACGDDGGGSADGDADFCTVANDIYYGTEPQPEGEADAEDIVDVFRRLEESAPPEIADDARVIRESIAVLLGVEEATADTPTQEELAAAEDRVRAYLRDECDIVPPDPTTTVPPTTTAAD